MLFAAEHYHDVDWHNPHWGWLFVGVTIGMTFTLLIHRLRGGQ